MNLGFYVHSTSDTPLNKDICQLLNDAIEGGVVKDASLFYNVMPFDKVEYMDDKYFQFFGVGVFLRYVIQ